VLHDTSPIPCARQWFFIIPPTFNDSTAIAWFSLTTRKEILCRKSFLWLATFSWHRASFRIAFSWFFDPFFFRDTRLCNTFNRWREVFRYRGFSIFSPVEKVAKSVKPTSIPTVVSDVNGTGLGSGSSSSTRMLTNHFPVDVTDTVAYFIFPVKIRWKTVLTSPILGNLIVLWSKFTW